MLKTIIPYEQRLEEYKKKRDEIFKDFQPEVTKKIAKTRRLYRNRKIERKEIASACLEIDDDIRPYMNVKLNGFNFTGLMDSGASISCLGNKCLENAQILNF